MSTDPDKVPPSWFVSFVKEDKKFKASTTDQLQKIYASNVEIKAEQIKIRHELTWRRTRDTLIDDCEILVSGLPTNADIMLEEATRRLLITIGMRDAVPYIRSARKWIVRNAADPSTALEQRDIPYVFKVGSQTVRDDIMLAASRLKNTSTTSAFGFNSTNRIYLRAIWHKPVHELYSSACRITKELNLPRPIVRQLTVFIRRAQRAELEPIYSQEDLFSLKRSIPCGPSRIAMHGNLPRSAFAQFSHPVQRHALTDLVPNVQNTPPLSQSMDEHASGLQQTEKDGTQKSSFSSSNEMDFLEDGPQAQDSTRSVNSQDLWASTQNSGSQDTTPNVLGTEDRTLQKNSNPNS